MDWSNERYARLYIRDTDDWLALRWEAKALFPLMLRKVDRSGLLATKRGATGVAAQTGLPLDVVAPGLADLLRDGCVVEVIDGYMLPNYIAAQEATASGAQRSRAHREKVRDTKRGAQQNVSEPTRDETSRNAVPSRAVPSRTEPSLAKPNQPYQPAREPVANPPNPADAAPLDAETARLLTIAANQAIEARYGEQPRPLLPASGHSMQIAQLVAESSIPIEFAANAIRTLIANRNLPEPPGSMAWFAKGIARLWNEHNAKADAASSGQVGSVIANARDGTFLGRLKTLAEAEGRPL